MNFKRIQKLVKKYPEAYGAVQVRLALSAQRLEDNAATLIVVSTSKEAEAEIEKSLAEAKAIRALCQKL